MGITTLSQFIIPLLPPLSIAPSAHLSNKILSRPYGFHPCVKNVRYAESTQHISYQSPKRDRDDKRCRLIRVNHDSLSKKYEAIQRLDSPIPFYTFPNANSDINWGVAESIPIMSTIPASLGSAMENPVEVIPTTTSLASIPMAFRYWRRAWKG